MKPLLIYLDTSFIVELYESAKNVNVPIRVVKKTNVAGNISGGFFSAGSTMEEEKEFPIPSMKMYLELSSELNQFPSIHFSTAKSDEVPELFWTEGCFAGGHPTTYSGSEVTAKTDIFQFQSTVGDTVPKWPLMLVTNDAYFVSGYDQIAKHGYALTCNFGIHVRMLCRILCYDKFLPIAAPMVILKLSNNVDALRKSKEPTA